MAERRRRRSCCPLQERRAAADRLVPHVQRGKTLISSQRNWTNSTSDDATRMKFEFRRDSKRFVNDIDIKARYRLIDVTVMRDFRALLSAGHYCVQDKSP